ncbi:MAG TPA: metal-dependent hydrolase with the TIM-barrel fold protein [Clostridiales bacterium]|nr:metal-dependent hydrolase with the TIM-barrel fold protein [Clostridiales bacterium]
MKVYAGTVVTCNDANTVSRFLVEDRGKIIHVGDELPEPYRQTPREDLNGRALLPAFVDTHLHFSSYALFAATLDVRQSRNHEEIYSLISDYVRGSSRKYVIGFGASANCVPERTLINRAELDRVCPDLPVMIVKYDGHAAVINTALMRELPEPVRKMRGYNADSGEMNQDAFFAVTDHMTAKVSPLDLVRFMLRGIDRLAGKGIGLIQAAEGVGFPRDLDVDLVRFLSRGQRNAFATRIYFQTMDIAKVLRRKLPRIGGCFATALDGCFGSEDAALLEPYTNDSQNRGVLFYTDSQVTEFVKAANRANLQVSLHAIGDAAFVQALNAIEAALQDFPREDHRHIIIHASLATREGLERVARLGIGIAMQPALLDWPQEPPEYQRHILGPRTEAISPLHSMLDLGIHIGGGSDAPCALPDPIEGIYQACNRSVPGQSITIPEALRLFTYEAARLSFDEKQRGSLENGKIADLVILNQNPLALPPDRLRSLQVEKLILSGRDYRPGQGLGSLLWNGLIGANPAR